MWELMENIGKDGVEPLNDVEFIHASHAVHTEFASTQPKTTSSARFMEPQTTNGSTGLRR